MRQPKKKICMKIRMHYCRILKSYFKNSRLEYGNWKNSQTTVRDFAFKLACAFAIAFALQQTFNIFYKTPLTLLRIDVNNISIRTLYNYSWTLLNFPWKNVGKNSKKGVQKFSWIFEKDVALLLLVKFTDLYGILTYERWFVALMHAKKKTLAQHCNLKVNQPHSFALILFETDR